MWMTQSSMFVSHWWPVKPRTQAQMKSSPELVHVASFMHGLEPHAFTSFSHCVPVQPGTQAHVKPLTWSVHVPPFWHGADAHSSMSVSQKSPVKPAKQWHEYIHAVADAALVLHGFETRRRCSSRS